MIAKLLSCVVMGTLLCGCASPDDRSESPESLKHSKEEGAEMTAEEAAALAVKVAEGTASPADAAQLEGYLQNGKN